MRLQIVGMVGIVYALTRAEIELTPFESGVVWLKSSTLPTRPLVTMSVLHLTAVTLFQQLNHETAVTPLVTVYP